MIVCAATNNAGKLKELRRILTRCGHEVKSLRELGVTLDPEETGTTFAENAKIKAEAFCKATGLPTVADLTASKITAAGSAPSPALTSGTPARSAQVSSCSLAAARKVSPAASMTRLPRSLYR